MKGRNTNKREEVEQIQIPRHSMIRLTGRPYARLPRTGDYLQLGEPPELLRSAIGWLGADLEENCVSQRTGRHV
ncbi:hypothetical protein BD779DRAFT_1119411 [Infundibulicybe gibba]|nr:hypothetical protein BD779DRAFT_1119411 [Infundibulicybe gibba]